MSDSVRITTTAEEVVVKVGAFVTTSSGGDIDLGTFYDFGSFSTPSNYNLDLGGF